MCNMYVCTTKNNEQLTVLREWHLWPLYKERSMAAKLENTWVFNNMIVHQ